MIGTDPLRSASFLVIALLIGATALPGVATTYMPVTEPKYEDIAVLPTYDSDEVTKATGTYPDSRSLIERSNRATYLLNRLLEIARGRQKHGDLTGALQAFEAAKKVDREHNNGNFFRENTEIGFLLGDMNRWIEAKRVFDRAINSRWKTDEAAKVATYCLEHNQNHIAMGYAKVLEKGVEDPVVTLTYSKVLAASKDKQSAVAAAERAYYLAATTGGDTNDAKLWLNSLIDKTATEPQPSKSFEKAFWNKVDRMLMRDTCPMPSDIQALADAPTITNGSVGYGGKTVIIGVKSDALKGAVRSANLQYDSEYYATGIGITPNILTCCLTKQDVVNHMKSIAKDGQAPNTELVEGLPVNEEYEEIQVKTDQKSVSFSFRKKGHCYLAGLGIIWKIKGDKLFKDKQTPAATQNQDWKSYFETAKVELRKRHFKVCKMALCRAAAYWSGQRHEASLETRRQEYESFKKTFIEMYEAWGRPEIAEYFKIVSFPQFERDVIEVESEMVIDFPTAAELRHKVWKVTFISSRILRHPN
jgi:hypothetical protein